MAQNMVEREGMGNVQLELHVFQLEGKMFPDMGRQDLHQAEPQLHAEDR